MKFWHSNPQLEITPIVTTSSSASAPGSENFAQGSCRTTETHSVPIYEYMPANNRNRTLGLPEHPFSHILLALSSKPQRGGPGPSLSLISQYLPSPWLLQLVSVPSVKRLHSSGTRILSISLSLAGFHSSLQSKTLPFLSYVGCHHFLHTRCLVPYLPLPSKT